MMADTMIDDTDFMILKCITDANQPLWKNKIHQYLTGSENNLQLTDSISVQTVGRRVDRLNDNDYLENAIVSPDELKRDLIIAFKTTEKGEQAIQDKREEILKNAIRNKMFSDNGIQLSQDALSELIRDEFELDEDTQHEVADEYSREELVTFLALYYAHQQVTDMFDEERMTQFQQLVPVEETLPINTPM